MPVRLAALVAMALSVALTGCRRPPQISIAQPTPPATPMPPPTPAPPPYVPSKRLETGRLFNGFQYHVTLETEEGTTATTERNTPGSYSVDLQVKVKVPKPHKELAEISRLNAKLPELLPELPRLLETSNISPVFD